jgi:hypothetical protein
MRKVLRVMATTAVGMTLLSCAAPRQPGDIAAIGLGIDGFDIGTIVGSVLASTEAYVLRLPRRVVYGPPRRTRNSYSDRSYARSKTPSPKAAHVPRTDAVEQKSEAKFRAAQAKAEKLGVHTLTKQDIDGLSREQLKQLRGY